MDGERWSFPRQVFSRRRGSQFRKRQMAAERAPDEGDGPPSTCHWIALVSPMSGIRIVRYVALPGRTVTRRDAVVIYDVRPQPAVERNTGPSRSTQSEGRDRMSLSSRRYWQFCAFPPPHIATFLVPEWLVESVWACNVEGHGM